MLLRVVIPLTITILLVTGGYVIVDWYSSAKPLDVPRHYVGKGACIDCHQQQVHDFHGSHHDRAMDVANEQTVLADFNDQVLEHDGIVSRMFKNEDRFFVHTEGPDGQLTDFEVKWVFGYYPLQQYMVELNRPEDALPHELGRVQVLRLSWDVEAQRWFYLRPPDVADKIDPGDPLHWTGITQNWNTSCAYCHSTNLKKNYDLLADNYRTTFSEINVSCEACHGPASLHVELANRRSLFWDRNHGYGLVNLKVDDNRVQVESCAPCHSRRSHLADGFTPGCNYHDYFTLQLLTDPVYHWDGQIRDENYVFGSFTQSKMFHAGVKCTDCHDPHTVRLKFEGNQVCTSCHQHPAGKYDTPAHHFHAPGTPGSNCVDCHMPETTYMMCDPRRDHSFRVPRPDLSVRFGTPNACTGCHLEQEDQYAELNREDLMQYLDWVLAADRGDQPIGALIGKVNQQMLDAVDHWYPADQREDRTVYYQQLAIGQAGQPESLPSLLSLARDQSVPAIFRATAFAVMNRYSGSEVSESAFSGINDASPIVVSAAVERLEQDLFTILDRMQYRVRGSADIDRSRIREIGRKVLPLLSHESRRVRISAARLILFAPNDILRPLFSPVDEDLLNAAVVEYHTALEIEQERGEVQMQLAALAELQGNLDLAIQHYEHAIRIDPELAGPRSNLAALLGTQQNQLQVQLQRSPQAASQSGQTEKQLEQLQNQIDLLRKKEHDLLARDLQRSIDLPNNHGLHYRFAMSSYLQGDLEATEKYLLEAYRQQPESSQYGMGLATYYLEVAQPDKALEYIQKLRQQDPNHEGYRLLQEKAQRMSLIESMR